MVVVPKGNRAGSVGGLDIRLATPDKSVAMGRVHVACPSDSTPNSISIVWSKGQLVTVGGVVSTVSKNGEELYLKHARHSL